MDMVQSKPVVVLAFANELEATRYLRNLPLEAKDIQAALEGICEVVVRYNVTLQEIVDVLQDRKFRDRITVFHYGGHAGGDLLLLESRERKNRPVYSEGIAALLGQLGSLKMVFLNGCSTQPQALQLQKQKIPLVIATTENIIDEVARNFAVRFYQGLAEGQTLYQAFEMAQSEQQAQLQIPRNAYRDVHKEGVDSSEYTAWPWQPYALEENEFDWGFADALNDPLFGLPPLPKLPLPEKPYRHLSFFEREHAEIFFGRAREIRTLYNHLSDRDSSFLYLLYGQAGVGKSSVLYAGLAPRLEANGEHTVVYQRREPQLGLLGSLRKALGLPEDAAQNQLAGAWESTSKGKPLVLILDQLEEAFTLSTTNQGALEIRDFLDDVAELAEKQLDGKLVLGFRKEWFAEIEQEVRRTKIAFETLLLNPLATDQVVEVVEGPTRSKRLASHYKIQLEPGLSQKIAYTLADKDSPVAPTLQLLLTKMWDQAKAENYEGPVFDSKRYGEYVEKGLGEFLDTQLEGIRNWKKDQTAKDLSELVDSGLALDLLYFHTSAAGTAQQRSQEEVCQQYVPDGDGVRAQQIAWLIQACSNQYLLTEPSRDQPNIFKSTRLTHDTLAPYVVDRFFHSLSPGQRARRILENRAVEWVGGKEGQTLDAQDLDRFKAGRPGMRSLNSDEERLVKKSQAERDEEIRKEEERIAELEKARKRAEQEKQQRLESQEKALQQLRWLAAGLMGLVLLVGGLGMYARNQQEDAKRQAAVAQQQRLQAIAQSLVTYAKNEKSREIQLLLARQAYQTYVSGGGQNLKPFDEALRELIGKSSELKSKPIKDNLDQVYALAVDPQGSRLAIARDKTSIGVFDYQNPSNPETSIAAGQRTLASVAVSPDGKYVAAGDDEGLIWVWEWDNAAGEALEKPTLRGHTDTVDALVFSPDNKTLFSGSRDKAILKWDLQGGSGQPTELKAQGDKAHGDWVIALAVSSDGTMLASGGGANPLTPRSQDSDTTIRIWPLAPANAQPVKLVKNPDVVQALAFDADHNLFSGDAGGTIRKWNPKEASKPPITLKGNLKEARAIAVSPSTGRLFAGAKDGQIFSWELQHITEQPQRIGKSAKAIFALTLSKDESTLISGDEGGAVLVWDLRPEYISTTFQGGNGHVMAVAFSPDGKKLAAASPDVAFGPDGKEMAVASQDYAIRVWNLDDMGADPTILRGHRGTVLALAYSLDGKLASGGEDNTIRLWKDNREVKSWLVSQKAISALAFSPDGKTLASGSEDNVVRLWDMAAEEPRPTPLTGHEDRINSLAFSPDSKTLASGGADAKVLLWDIDKPNEKPKSLTHGDSVISIAFSTDGRSLSSASRDERLRLWDIGTLKTKLEFAKSVNAVAFSKDGKGLIYAQDGSVQMMNLLNPQEKVALDEGQVKGYLYSLALDPQGRFGAWAELSTGRVVLWRTTIELADMVCKLVERNLTKEEWTRYTGDRIEYAPVCAK